MIKTWPGWITLGAERWEGHPSFRLLHSNGRTTVGTWAFKKCLRNVNIDIVMSIPSQLQVNVNCQLSVDHK